MEKLSDMLKNKYISEGIYGMTEKEIVQLMLAYCEKDSRIPEISENLFRCYANFKNIMDTNYNFILRSCDINQRSGILIGIISQLERYYYMEENKISRISEAKQAKLYFQSYFKTFSIEHLVVAVTDERFKIKNTEIISVGNVDSVDVSIRQFADSFIKSNGKFLFIAHNHPENKCTPSSADINVTGKIIDVMNMLEIPVIDHIITGTDGTVSMREICDIKFSECKNYICDEYKRK